MNNEIPRSTQIMINAWAIERFQGSCVDFQGTDFEFITFGSGRRMSPGIPFAFGTVELALSQLLSHFNQKLHNKIITKELDMSESYGLATK